MARSNTTKFTTSVLNDLNRFPELHYDCRYAIWQAIVMLPKKVEVEAVETGNIHRTGTDMDETEVKLELVSMHTFPTMFVNRESRCITQKNLRTWMKSRTDFTFHLKNADAIFRPQNIYVDRSNLDPWPVFRLVDTVTSISFDIRTIFKTWKGFDDDWEDPDNDEEELSWRYTAEELTTSLKRLPNLREVVLVLPPEFDQTIVIRTHKEAVLPHFKPKTTIDAISLISAEMHDRISQGRDFSFTPARYAYNDGCNIRDKMREIANRTGKGLSFTVKLQCWNFEDWNTKTPQEVTQPGQTRTRRLVKDSDGRSSDLLGTEVVGLGNRVFERLCWKRVAEEEE
ncbi:hypothetical protein BDZ45DRAFT_811796 [Acephala macrosclerotiorum]|nr:hypothetical protein BDZ45DRAFT_811796 [Acephala macrosclerotiorum]